MKRVTVISLFLLSLLVISMLELGLNSSFADGPPIDTFQKWISPVGETVSSFVVTNNSAYFISRDSESYTGTFYCLDAPTGNQVWNHSAMIGNRSVIIHNFTVANGYVYIAEFVSGVAYRLLCFDGYNGTILWANDLNGYVGTPVVAGNCVYITAGSAVYSFDAITGEKKWDYGLPVDTSFKSLFVEDGYVCTISFTEKQSQSYSSCVYMFNAYSGQKIWTQQIWSYTDSAVYSPSLNMGNDTIFVSYKVTTANDDGSGSLFALDTTNGTILWKYTPTGFVGGFTLDDNIVYCSGSSGSVCALNGSSGQEIWTFKDESRFGSVFVADGRLYVSSTTGVACFNPESGVRIWSYQAKDYNAKPSSYNNVIDILPTNPTYADGVVYFGWNGPQWWLDKTEHNFYALTASTGAVIWENPLSYSIIVPPAVVNHTLYIGGSGVTTRSPTWAENGAVIAFNLCRNSELLPFDSILLIVFAGCSVVLVVLIFLKQEKRQKRPMRLLRVAASV